MSNASVQGQQATALSGAEVRRQTALGLAVSIHRELVIQRAAGSLDDLMTMARTFDRFLVGGEDGSAAR